MSNLTRRQFVKRSAAFGVVSAVGFPSLIRGQGLNEKLQVGFIAVGGRAGAHTGTAHEEGCQCIAFAEVDKGRWGGVLEKKGWEQAKGYTDWRKVFQNHAKELDVVFVSTPDHTHFAPSMTAVSMGIHCYTEKPLTWSVREAQLLAAAYAKNPKVVTQQGNQGHGGNGWRLAYEYVKAGAVGDIKEFHTWTNRPIWPQGGDRPQGSDPVPENLDWEAWIGPAPMRPYKGNRAYHDFNWRGVVDFGSGALGDMACHTTDGIYSIMNPGYAATAEPFIMTGPVKDQWPAGMVVKSTYRAKDGRPGFKTFWYEGVDGNGRPFMPDTPEELEVDGRQLPRTGNLIIGSKGKMLVIGDYWETPMIIPEARRKEFGRPAQLLERSPGHHKEFFMACRGEKPREFSQSNFGYSGPMAANIQLGNLCARAGKKLELNEAGEITSDPKINELAWREPRAGWGPLEMKV
ncbi:MAG: Gfo/Idh/MocA family oxidoreductase [Sedimentisphaerales bacterium]|jgi:predicted dehydrogenase|nr:Gfo/Idh/MocA family oxidoreductase [Sedimentisphaerales bacterium]HNY77056.1 Gfo/Idh/MocA family oxidoreductase [Sedimentisphaerales bacterium]HOC62529.1 Gfo/Idh/MocA family oxidoreductase [Sedimentisphaerales bacterium]HOH63047.1 Gfo/Idh/MocA family oxidoreductase [Sedimentisphaerales bacterium]HPY49620.1 Gfo/Idh/MocA family oxidoreductase [Sedimentisphaerales bacterium]